MKVLQITNAWPTEKIPVYGIFIAEQVESLRELGVEIELLFINAREKGALEYLRSIRKIRRAAQNAEIVHYHHVYSALCGVAARVKAPSLVSFMGDGVHQFKPWMPRWLTRSLLQLIRRRTDRHIYKCLIPEELRDDPKNIFLPNGVNLDYFSPIERSEAKRRLGWDLESRYLLFVSFYDRDRPAKRYWLFKEVLEILQNKYAHRDLKEFCMVDEPRERVPLIFNACELHLLVSSNEGSPNSIKEALACNTPVVATDVGSVSHLLEGVPECRVASSDNPEEIAEAVHAVLGEKRSDLRHYLVKKGLDRRSVASQLVEIYSNLSRQGNE